MLEDEIKVENLIKEFNSSDEDMRDFLEKLYKISDETITILIRLFENENKQEESRILAAYTLGEIGDQSAFYPLVQGLDYENDKIRAAAIIALGDLGDAKALKFLNKFVTDQRHIIRTSAAYSLGKLGGKRVIDLIISMLSDENASVRWQAATSLGKIEDVKVIEPLFQTLEDKSRRVQNAAFEALQLILPEIAKNLGVRETNQVFGLFLEALSSQKESIRLYAVSCLVGLGDKRAIEPLMLSLHDVSSKVRRRIVSSLGVFNDTQTLPALTEMLKDEDRQVSTQAAFVIKNWGKFKYMNILESHSY